ncbi:fatty-acyl elongase, putative [Perkinsus marinus ATCC 50983]|uniref:Elongation of fatty acids protein n=1 Tax=Perkinsus marinus (strain ATCC 50983 / TXsc) TaxID=423536 RepID=C5LIE5_PERM5|nr:fatty-acyl elongase, putative [Perkinsus marinus ATCC 50983]EER03348.1 fatty-acyl elongase, putative [Perkinsus marinus ATCC 50983]|eukprot:XP_002771532.1 fatty-acyl elongase, putative [Perkinsus marinus ATCC 50983]
MIELPFDNIMDRSPEVWTQMWTREEVINQSSYGFTDPLYTEALPEWTMPYIGPAAWEDSETALAKMTMFMRHYWWLSYVVIGLYLIAVPTGQHVMKNRQAFKLKKPLALWNLFLAVFSFTGMLRTLPHLLNGTFTNGPLYFVCRNVGASYGPGPTGIWVGLFIFSKYIELTDTAFLVLRKRNVNFLHWFHHATVLLYCWHAGAYEQPTGIFFATMNYMVHSIMYFYYFLSSVGHKPRWGLTVTILQIAQMLIGMFVVAIHYYALRTVPRCDGATQDLSAAFLMYTAYLILFAQFFVGRYVSGGSKKAKKE